MSLSNYLKGSIVLPLIISLVVGIVLAITHDGSGYKSEWSTDDGFVLTVVLTIFLSGIISLLSLTLLFNRRAVIRNNHFLSFITWLLLPGILCLFVIYEECGNFTGRSDIDGSYEGSRLLDGYFLGVAALHLVCLFIGYTYFRYKMKNLGKEIITVKP